MNQLLYVLLIWPLIVLPQPGPPVNYSEKIRELNELLKKDPGNNSLIMQRAYMFLSLQDSRMPPNWQDTSQERPGDVDVLKDLDRLVSSKNRFVYPPGSQDTVTLPALYSLRAEWYYKTGSPDKAIADLLEALERQLPQNRAYLYARLSEIYKRKGDNKQAYRYFCLAHPDEKSPGAELTELSSLTTELEKIRYEKELGLQQDAVIRFQHLINNSILFYDRALASGESAISLDTRRESVFERIYWFAEYFVEQGRPDKAKMLLQSALSYRPCNEGGCPLLWYMSRNLHYLLARIYEKEGDRKNAVAQMLLAKGEPFYNSDLRSDEAAYSGVPKTGSADELLLHSLIQMQARRMLMKKDSVGRQLVGELNKATELASADPRPYYYKAVIYSEMMGDQAAALKEIDLAIGLYKYNPFYYEVKVQILEKAKSYEEIKSLHELENKYGGHNAISMQPFIKSLNKIVSLR